jgi:hypothetical protein
MIFSLSFLGCPVLFFQFGQWDIRKALENEDKENLRKYKDQVLVQIMRLMVIYRIWAKKENPQDALPTVTQFIALSDWDEFSLR